MQAQLLTSAEIEALRERAVRAEEELRKSQSEKQQLLLRVICTQKDQKKLQAKGKSHVDKWASLIAEDSRLGVNKLRAINRLWKEYKQYFGLPSSYRDTPECRFEEGLHWIDAWSMPSYLIETIELK